MPQQMIMTDFYFYFYFFEGKMMMTDEVMRVADNVQRHHRDGTLRALKMGPGFISSSGPQS